MTRVTNFPGKIKNFRRKPLRPLLKFLSISIAQVGLPPEGQSQVTEDTLGFVFSSCDLSELSLQGWSSLQHVQTRLQPRPLPGLLPLR